MGNLGKIGDSTENDVSKPYEGATKGIMFRDGVFYSITPDARRKVQQAMVVADRVTLLLQGYSDSSAKGLKKK